MKNIKNFNIVISGTGGQGLLTLLQIISEAAFKEGYDVRTSELHGMAQRGGSVEVHVRFGNKIYSPLVKRGGADLIINLEAQEALRAVCFANANTVMLINRQFIPVPLEKVLTEEEIKKGLQKITKNAKFISASEICQKEFGTNVVSGIYLLSLAISKKIIDLKEESILNAIKKIIPAKHLELNLKVFNLAKKSSEL